ncbi:MAG: DUF5664 domain-containing protein [Planctomycetia bacterium]|nr:DUF5664 domain-containing protein [Planctomycetia bacterium]
MEDSGERQQFASGAVRDTAAGKPRPDLISPHAHMREGTWLGIGAVKYAERNWEAGIPISRCVASLFRHLVAYMLGQDNEDHMAAIRTNAGFIIHNEEEVKAGRMDPTIMDMPFYEQKPALYDEDEDPEELDMSKSDGRIYSNVSAADWQKQMLAAVEQNNVVSPPYHVLELTPRVTGVGYHDPIPGPEAARGVTQNQLGELVAMTMRSAPETLRKYVKAKSAQAMELVSTIRARNAANRQSLVERLGYTPTEDGRCGLCEKRHPENFESVVYIAGPMRGYPQYNFPAFHGAAEEWSDLGWGVIDPAALDEAQGFNPETDDVQDAGDFMKRDIDCIMGLDVENGDGLAVLPGWEKSIGARAEVALARWRGLPVWEATTGKAIE